MNKIHAFLIFFLLVSLPVNSQDEVLLTIGKRPFMLSEFERIYHKNNNIQGYEQKSIDEYLTLFINYKLKVIEAESLGYDTMRTFIKELNGYREQLARPYLQERQLIDKLLEEAYYRTINEVNASHIMVKVPSNPTPEDTLKAYNRIIDIRKRIMNGEAFEKIAREESDDPSAKSNGGLLGWFSAFTMTFPFEQAAYHTNIGEISMPVRSRFGYHVIKVNQRRPSLGEIKLAHIMIRSDKNNSKENSEGARERIFNCYDMLQKDSLFAKIAKSYSEDEGTSQNGGQMRWIKSGELPSDIEEQVFALKEIGDYTVPLQSTFGWHIFQLLNKRPPATFKQIKSNLEERVMADERGKIAEQMVIDRIKKESGFRIYSENVKELANKMDSSVYTGQWRILSDGDLIEPVFTIYGKEFTQKDLAEFILMTRQYRKDLSISSIVERRCTELAQKELINAEKNRLEEKYPEFRYLMEEYHDGILLFNITDDKVWKKAVKDTAGLKAFYEQRRDNYMWKERADISIYTVNDELYLKSTRKLARKRIALNLSAKEFISSICKSDSSACISIEDMKFEKGDSGFPVQLKWRKGSLKTFQQNNLTKIAAVNAIIPPINKSLEEIRGQVTADYQNYIEEQWIAALRAKYVVKINQDILKNAN
jgi:peptidyl-prolyl cis-trans isomerase SurA